MSKWTKEYKREYMKRYREEKAQEISDWRKDYVDKNRANINALGRTRIQRFRYKNPASIMFSTAKTRAKKKDLQFTITKQDIVIPSHCPIFGIELCLVNTKLSDNSPSLDRINCQLGYIPGNIHVISNKANRIKNNASLAELRMIVDYLHKLS